MIKIKRIILVFVLFLLCGCSVEYDLTIYSDSSVSEKVIASEITNRMKTNTGLDENNAVTYLYDMFKREGYKTRINTVKKNNKTISTVTGSYNSIDEYGKKFKSDLIKEAEVTKSGDNVTIKLNQTEPLLSDSNRSLVYDDVTINITVPFKVLKHNADSYNKDTYTWHINKDKDLKKISITYDSSSEKNKQTIKIGDKKINIRVDLIAIFSFTFIIMIIIVIVFINNKKNNKV